MASEIEHVSSKPVQGFRRLRKEYRKLAETETAQLPFREGSSLTQSDFELMDISIDEKAKSGFWIPAHQERRAALQSALTSYLEEKSASFKSYLNDSMIQKERLAEYRSPTMGAAYCASIGTIAFILQLVDEGVYYNEGLLDASGDNIFQNLRCVRVSACFLGLMKLTWPQSISCMRSNVPIQTHEGFATPGYPHVTIISVQPQLARSQKELLCTEIWTLYYWASKLASRVLHTTNHYLPVSLNYPTPHS